MNTNLVPDYPMAYILGVIVVLLFVIMIWLMKKCEEGNNEETEG